MDWCSPFPPVFSYFILSFLCHSSWCIFLPFCCCVHAVLFQPCCRAPPTLLVYSFCSFNLCMVWFGFGVVRCCWVIGVVFVVLWGFLVVLIFSLGAPPWACVSNNVSPMSFRAPSRPLFVSICSTTPTCTLTTHVCVLTPSSHAHTWFCLWLCVFMFLCTWWSYCVCSHARVCGCWCVCACVLRLCMCLLLSCAPTHEFTPCVSCLCVCLCMTVFC